MSFEEWKLAVNCGDVESVRSLLADPEIAARINESVFAFNSSAVFSCRQNLQMVDALLGFGADLNQKTEWCAGGFGILEGLPAEFAESLIERGARIDIWAAVSLNRIDDVRNILDSDASLISAPGGDGKHPLHYAQSIEMVDLLVNAGADVNARDIDHTSTPLQYLIENESVAGHLVKCGAHPDIFAASAMGDSAMVAECLKTNPDSANARLGMREWSNDAGGNIYNWTLGHDLTPQDVARANGHSEILSQLLKASSTERQLMDAIWNGQNNLADDLVASNPLLINNLSDDSRKALARACWLYRPEAVQMMLQLGFDPHVAGVHDSTPLDRASLHGYADIVELLLQHDSNPPIDRKNEFDGTPLGACIHGFKHGWKTGFPQDHFSTIQLLLQAGARRADGSPSVGDSKIDDLLASF